MGHGKARRTVKSLGHSFEIFSCEGLIRSVDVLYPAATTRQMKNMNFLSMKYRFTVIPGQKLSKEDESGSLSHI